MAKAAKNIVTKKPVTKKVPAKKAVVKKQTQRKMSKPKVSKPPTPAEKLNKIGIEHICDQIMEGIFFQDIANLADVSRTSLTKWLETEHKNLYASAREERYHRLAEQVIEISDYSKEDTYIDSQGVERTDAEVVARSRLRVDARKWYVAKMLPKQYGDRTTIAGDAENPLAVLTMDQITANPKSRIKA